MKKYGKAIQSELLTLILQNAISMILKLEILLEILISQKFEISWILRFNFLFFGANVWVFARN